MIPWIPLLLLGASAQGAGGRLFVELDVGLPGRPATAVAISPGDDRVILGAMEGLLFRSTNGGESWSVVLRTSAQNLLPVEEQLDLEDAAEESAEDELGMGAAAEGIPEDFAPDLDQVDVDAALEELEEDIQETLTAPRETGVDTGLPEGDIDVGTDVPIPWPQELPGIHRVVFQGPERVWVATHRGLYLSTDVGLTFNLVSLPRSARVQDVRDVCLARDNVWHILVATGGGALWSADGGESWVVAPGAVGRVPALTCALGSGVPAVMAVGSRYGLATSVDGGGIFEGVLLPGEGANGPVFSIAVDHAVQRIYAVTPHLLYAGNINARMLSPAGAAWRDGLHVIRTLPGRTHQLWAGGRRGVFVSHDDGRNGMELGAESMIRDVLDLSVSPQNPDWMVAATVHGVFGYLRVDDAPAGPFAIHRFKQILEREPTAQEVADWAVSHHRVDPKVTTSMRIRSRLAALGPAFTLTATPPMPTGLGNLDPLAMMATSRSVGNTYVVEGVATWNPDRILLSRDEVYIQREHRRLLQERERVWARVVRTYEARRRMQATLVQVRSRNVLTHGRKLLRLQELNALLDAETGGRFSREVRARGASVEGVPPVPEARESAGAPR